MNKNFAASVLLVLSLAFSSFASVGDSKRYDMTFVDADFQSVFHSISRLANRDILLAPDVQGRLSMTVTQKTWLEMMEIVCNLHDLTWLFENNYISVQRTATYQQKIIMESEKREQSDMVAPLARRSFQIKHASASEMASVLQTIKSSRGNISVIERNNAIIVYDTEKRLEQMQNTLNELDVETLQIVITAKLVVVDSRLANELGVDWSTGFSNSRMQGDISNTPIPPRDQSDALGDIARGTALEVRAFDGNMSATISNLLGDSRTEILASPQVATMDHTEAVIFMGEEVTLTIPGDGVSGTTTRTVESGVKLTVTPHVAGDSRILLELSPESNDYGYDVQGNLVVNKRMAQTKVVVSDGETVVIAGLTNNFETESETGIPFLKDIPILGYLFKHTKKRMEKKDLVIFVTPRIVRNYLSDSPVARAAPAPAARAVESDEDDDGWE